MDQASEVGMEERVRYGGLVQLQIFQRANKPVPFAPCSIECVNKGRLLTPNDVIESEAPGRGKAPLVLSPMKFPESRQNLCRSYEKK